MNSEKTPIIVKTKTKRHSSHRCVSHSSHSETERLLPGKRSDYGGTNSFPSDHDLSDNSNGSGQKHCHRADLQEERMDKRARRKLIMASILCLLFMLGEVFGGFFANSLAIATDAAHLLTDFASFMISLFAIWMASRPATKRMSFGWYRAEVVGALVSVLLIWVVTAILVYIAVLRVISMDFEIDATIMLITAACGVAINILMGLTLHDSHGHGHSHGGMSHGHNRPTESSPPGSDTSLEKGSSDDHEGGSHSHTNINVRAAFIHVLGDLVQSIGVLVAAFIIFFQPNWKIADPICTFLFSVLVLITTINILRDTMNVLMEGTPRSIDYKNVKHTLLKVKGVREIHNLRIWSLTLNKIALSVHLALDKTVSAQYVLGVAGQTMREKFGIYECTMQIEDYVDEMLDCDQCQDPKD